MSSAKPHHSAAPSSVHALMAASPTSVGLSGSVRPTRTKRASAPRCLRMRAAATNSCTPLSPRMRAGNMTTGGPSGLGRWREQGHVDAATFYHRGDRRIDEARIAKQPQVIGVLKDGMGVAVVERETIERLDDGALQPCRRSFGHEQIAKSGDRMDHRWHARRSRHQPAVEHGLHRHGVHHIGAHPADDPPDRRHQRQFADERAGATAQGDVVMDEPRVLHDRHRPGLEGRRDMDGAPGVARRQRQGQAVADKEWRVVQHHENAGGLGGHGVPTLWSCHAWNISGPHN